MSQPPIAALECPRCPKCEEPMLLIRSLENGSRSEVRTFECAKCGQDKIIETFRMF